MAATRGRDRADGVSVLRFDARAEPVDRRGNRRSGMDRRPSGILALDLKSLFHEELAHAVADVSLQLHAFVRGGPTRPAGALQFLREVLEKRVVVRQSVDNGDRLPAASCLLDAELRDRTVGHTLLRSLAAPAPALRQSASGADAPC